MPKITPAKNIPTELQPLMAQIAPKLRALKIDTITFEKIKEAGLCEVTQKNGHSTIRYSTPSLANRALGTLISGLAKSGATAQEKTPFQMLGIMLDCSRNAVMTIEHLTNVWLPKLALLGYNTLMLYTEETYQLPEEPYFGCYRGAYSAKELKEIVRAAATFNIEVIPCIQTLGHLEHLLKHDAYREVRDTSSVLLVGESKTYELIEKMIKHWSGICTTRRIHLGMDETHDLGRGRYLDQHGHRPGVQLFNEHLARVTKICKKYKMEPMIWSDMYFRLGCESGDYYDPKTRIPQKVINLIPAEVDLVYWDYYHEDPKFYLEWIKRHRAMKKEPLMASGVWTWNRYWYDYHLTEANAGACVRACYQAGLKELVFTMWGDNGAYCDHDSAFAGLAYCADLAFGAKQVDVTQLEKRFNAVCGGSYRSHRLAGDLNYGAKSFTPNFWEDPFFECSFRAWAKDHPQQMRQVASHYRTLANRLKPLQKDRATGDLRYAYRTAEAFAERYELSTELLHAYRKRDLVALRKIQSRLPRSLKALRAMADAFREMWLTHNKPEGLEIMQGRFGMLEARYREIDARLEDFLKGRTDRLSELDSPCPPA